MGASSTRLLAHASAQKNNCVHPHTKKSVNTTKMIGEHPVKRGRIYTHFLYVWNVRTNEYIVGRNVWNNGRVGIFLGQAFHFQHNVGRPFHSISCGVDWHGWDLAHGFRIVVPVLGESGTRVFPCPEVHMEGRQVGLVLGLSEQIFTLRCQQNHVFPRKLIESRVESGLLLLLLYTLWIAAFSDHGTHVQ